MPAARIAGVAVPRGFFDRLLTTLAAIGACAFVLPAASGAAVEPGQPIKTIYIAPMSHLDIGFTAPPSAVAAKSVRSVQSALARAAADPEYVWNFEEFWELEQWLRAKPSEADLGRLIGLAKAGRVMIGASYLTPHTGVMSAWALDWLFRLPTQWGREHGLTLETAVLDDVPGHPADLPRFLAANGVRYLVVGANLSFQAPLPQEIASRPFWWEAPTGERVLTWISDRGYSEAFNSLGFHPGAARLFNRDKFGGLDDRQVMEKGVRETLDRYRQRGYPYDAVLALHAFDNWGSGSGSADLPRCAKAWNETHESPKVVVSTPQAFLKHIEAAFGRELPVYRGGFGGLWEGVRSGVPTAARIGRAAEAALRRASQPDPEDIRRLLVFYEHSFGMGAPGWPTMTREEAVQHNREQAELVAALGRVAGFEAPPASRPEAAGAHAPPRLEGLASNALYALAHHPMILPPSLKNFQFSIPNYQFSVSDPLPAHPSMPDRGTRLRYWIDRRKLPADPTYVVWLHRLDAEEAGAKVRNRIASGWETLPDGHLAGYDWGGWTSPFGFQLGRVVVRPAGAETDPPRRGGLLSWEFRGDGVFTFRRLSLGGENYLLGLCMQHGLTGVFKGGTRGTLTFDEAYPGEEPLVELSVAIEPMKPGSP